MNSSVWQPDHLAFLRGFFFSFAWVWGRLPPFFFYLPISFLGGLFFTQCPIFLFSSASLYIPPFRYPLFILSSLFWQSVATSTLVRMYPSVERKYEKRRCNKTKTNEGKKDRTPSQESPGFRAHGGKPGGKKGRKKSKKRDGGLNRSGLPSFSLPSVDRCYVLCYPETP